jgi:hypothetical protein
LAFSLGDAAFAAREISMQKTKEKPRKPLDLQGGLKTKPGQKPADEGRDDPRKPRQPHFDESADRGQGSDPGGGRQAR